MKPLKETDPMLSLLDSMEHEAGEDDHGLQALAEFVIAQSGFPTGKPFLAHRYTLSAMLCVLNFQLWQMFPTVRMIENDGTEIPNFEIGIEPQIAATAKQSMKPKWLRIVDLGLEGMRGRAEFMGPYKHAYIDRHPVQMDIKGFAYFLKCARYASWSEPGWSLCESVAAATRIIHEHD